MPQYKIIAWADVLRQLEPIDVPGNRLFGVPKAGMIAVGFARHAERVYDPAQATHIVDDLVDSGATRERWAQNCPKAVFFPLFVKSTEEKRNGVWYVFPWEHEEKDGPRDAVRRLIEWIGDDPTREGLIDTPRRVLKAMREMTSGLVASPKEILGTVFHEDCDQMIVVNGIQFHSLCEHHMLPFSGVMHVGYVPDGGRIVGLSKIPRLVHCFARRLQVQERLGEQIASAIETHLAPKGVGIIIRSTHSCMAIRGVQSPGGMLTSIVRGVFTRDEVRSEFLSLVGA